MVLESIQAKEDEDFDEADVEVNEQVEHESCSPSVYSVFSLPLNNDRFLPTFPASVLP